MPGGRSSSAEIAIHGNRHLQMQWLAAANRVLVRSPTPAWVKKILYVEVRATGHERGAYQEGRQEELVSVACHERVGRNEEHRDGGIRYSIQKIILEYCTSFS